MTSKLETYTDEQLLEEIQKREQKRTEQLLASKLDKEINLESLRCACATYLENIRNDEYDEDDQHYIFEAALEMLYGEEIWDWVNSRT